MESLLGTRVDLKNIGLAKLIFDLRQDLDLYCLLCANWDKIDKCFGVAGLFPQIRRRALGGVVLGLCKVYEVEGERYPLNSINGLMKQLKIEDVKPRCDSSVHEFVQSYYGTLLNTSAVAALDLTVNNFRGKYEGELKSFKEARDKVIAHSEFPVLIDTLPSYDVMEKLFRFGADFYAVVTRAFVGGGPDDLKRNSPTKVDFVRLLEQMGIKNVKTDVK